MAGRFFSPLRKIAQAEIISTTPVRPTNGPVLGGPGSAVASESFVFQYWPESLSDSKSVEYAEKMVPGASHPLYQFVRGGARSLGFSAIFTKDVNTDNPLDPAPQNDTYTRDINAAVWALRRFIYPSYGEGDLKAFPPEFLTLKLPGTALGGFNSSGPVDSLTCIMSRCDVEYRAWFPDGTPRFATVDLEFWETVQGDPREPADIRYVDRFNFSAAWTRYLNRQITRPPSFGSSGG